MKLYTIIAITFYVISFSIVLIYQIKLEHTQIKLNKTQKELSELCNIPDLLNN